MALLNSTTVVLIGGKLGDKYYSPETYMLNTAAESEEWIQGPALNFGRDYHSCAAIRCQFHQHFMRIFLHKSVLHSFSVLTVGFCNVLLKNIGTKAACEMLMKLTTERTTQVFSSASLLLVVSILQDI